MNYQPGLFDAPPVDTFHNTIGYTGHELKDRQMRSEAQGRKILDFFRQHPDESFTPYEILDRLHFNPFQITSVRRALTNLTRCRERYLRMTGVKTLERQGDKNNRWCLNEAADQRGYGVTLIKNI